MMTPRRPGGSLLVRLAWLACVVASVLASVLASPAGATAAVAGDIELRSRSVEITISDRGGLPLRWLACAGACADPGTRRQDLVTPGDGALRWAADD
ncbi:MAG: hypothetical protein IT512_01690, partial [Rhodocyclaceae bacterium]|nr:hypothetical protein [Rhodocyclaceae bacterium]